MVRYFKTTGIYADSNLLRVEVKYDSGGYWAKVTPCHKDKSSWGVLYNEEYYKHYNTLMSILVPCNRKSVKKEAEAHDLINERMDWLLEQYVIMAENKGGRHIEIVGELED